MTFTKEQLLNQARENVKALKMAVVQNAFKDIRPAIELDLALAELAFAGMEAVPVYQFIYNNPYEEGYTEWLDCNENYFNGVPEDCRRILYAAPQPATVVPDVTPYLHGLWPNAADALIRYSEDCRAAMLQAGNSPVIQEGWVTVPVEMTAEQMRAVQIKSELGEHATANLAGAYSLFSEFWRVAISATTKKEV